MNKKKLYVLVLSLFVCFNFSICFAPEAFAATGVENEIDSSRWYRDDVVTVSYETIYSDVYDRKVEIEETKTEVYYVYVSNGRRVLQYTRYDVLWNGYRKNAEIGEWELHPLYTNQRITDVDRGYILDILSMMGFDSNV